MSLWSRITNVFRGSQVNRDIDEELRSHIEEAVGSGRDPNEVRRSFGSLLRTREISRDVKVSAWLDSLHSDISFGARQLWKHKTASSAAILSLGLAMGTCLAAFCLIDALLLRPLPVTDAQGLYVLSYEYKDDYGAPQRAYDFSYPCFQDMQTMVGDDAALLAIAERERIGLTYGAEDSPERAYRQYISGRVLANFDLRAAAGRLFTESDDSATDHTHAVISYDYWTRKFGQNPAAIGQKILNGEPREIIGVAPRGFTGTETGAFTDVFLPMNANVEGVRDRNWNWLRIWVRSKPGVSLEAVREKLGAALHAFRKEQVKTWSFAQPKRELDSFVAAKVNLEPAASGFSLMQREYRDALLILAILVALVLLIACANVANLMAAQAAARAREMAVRVSLGAGRKRLMQLVLTQSALLALSACALGAVFAGLAAPYVVGMINPPDDPARLALKADWRVSSFAAVLCLGVTLLFGLAPALRASGVSPAAVLKGGQDPHARRRLMKALIAAQVAFCLLVYYAAGLFVATFQRMSHQQPGFYTERLLTLETSSSAKQPIESWSQITQRLRELPSVESVGLCWWPLMSGNGWDQYIWANGHSPGEGIAPYFLKVGPGWLETMKIPLIDGRDFREDEAFPQTAIVNESFARRYFAGLNPLRRSLEIVQPKVRVPLRIVGYVRDARYRDMREPIRATVYVPFRSVDTAGQFELADWATFVVRTKQPNPMKLASLLRSEVHRTRSEFRVVNVRTQEELLQSHMVRERMLAVLAMFFAGVALVLAGVGLWGVLNYSVVQRRREIGIRMALGSQARRIVAFVTVDVISMTTLGCFVGLAAGVSSGRFVEKLLYQVRASDTEMMALPVIIMLVIAATASLPALLRALRIDPAVTLREE